MTTPRAVRYRIVAERGSLLDGVTFSPDMPRNRRAIDWTVSEQAISEARDPLTILRRMSTRAANALNKDMIQRVINSE